jgi:hypothetical protein
VCQISTKIFISEDCVSGEYFIEQRPDGRYNVSKPNAVRASAVTDTQAEGIDSAKQLNPNATIHVEESEMSGRAGISGEKSKGLRTYPRAI